MAAGGERILCLAVSYGGRDDILQACVAISKEITNGMMNAKDLTEETISAQISTGRLNIPDPDLIVRTGGDFRLSNFLLWQSAYAEFASVECTCNHITCSLFIHFKYIQPMVLISFFF